MRIEVAAKGKGKGKGKIKAAPPALANGPSYGVKGKGKIKAAPLALANGPSYAVKGGVKGQWVQIPDRFQQSGGKGGGKGGGKSGYDPVEAEAIREIKEQLRDPSSEGRVWVDGWGTRFQNQLGSLRDFLDSRPDKFTVLQGAGRKFTVEVAQHAAPARQVVQHAAPARANVIKARQPASSQAKQEYTNTMGGANAAVREITEQLREQGGAGNVWIQGWGKRYEESLGPLRDFLEMNADKFTIVPGQGRKFHVELAKGGAQKRKRQEAVQPSGPPPKKGKGGGKGGAWNPLVAEAIRTIKDQLNAPDSDGRVWVPQWGQRFQSELGSLRDFLESKPEKFRIIPGEGRKFLTELA